MMALRLRRRRPKRTSVFANIDHLLVTNVPKVRRSTDSARLESSSGGALPALRFHCRDAVLLVCY